MDVYKKSTGAEQYQPTEAQRQIPSALQHQGESIHGLTEVVSALENRLSGVSYTSKLAGSTGTKDGPRPVKCSMADVIEDSTGQIEMVAARLQALLDGLQL